MHYLVRIDTSSQKYLSWWNTVYIDWSTLCFLSSTRKFSVYYLKLCYGSFSYPFQFIINYHVCQGLHWIKIDNGNDICGNRSYRRDMSSVPIHFKKEFLCYLLVWQFDVFQHLQFHMSKSKLDNTFVGIKTESWQDRASYPEPAKKRTSILSVLLNFSFSPE
jgi:hypothetical protein